MSIHNIAAYQFANWRGLDLKNLRAQLQDRTKALELKGTILISPEGMNMFMAGAPESIEPILMDLRALPGMGNLKVKLSESDHQPFNRMLVRIKKEIIAFGVEGIHPEERTSPKLEAHMLKQWLDEGRPITLLDTRNDYEVRLGTFKNALPMGIDHFRDFPTAVEKLPPELKQQPIVMFCTGGIRCEKAGPYMERAGFQKIYQLDGGILKYFEECGDAHYQGECFVFDQRVGVDPSLHETDSALCFQCLSPLTKTEQEDDRYTEGKSCPYCFKSTAEKVRLGVQARQRLLEKFTHPLPGSVAYDNYRPLSVPQVCEGMKLLAFLGHIVAHIPSDEWESLCERGLLLNYSKTPVGANHIVHAGERYLLKLPNMTEPDVNGNVQIIHEDEALVVINKPAPLPMHPGGRFNRNTLQYFIDQAYHPQRPHPAHRIDANTTGLVLLTRTRHFASRLQPQFARGEVKKSYLVRVQGIPPTDSFSCHVPISAEPGDVGSRDIDPANGLPANTEFVRLKNFEDGTCLLEAKPLTGRTNQIRIHLWELGFPVVGDMLYLPGKMKGEVQTQTVNCPTMCLHAWRIGFHHPIHGGWVEFETPKPAFS